MIIAGGESTASAIRSILVHTMTTPRVYLKLKAETEAALDEGKVSSPVQIDQALKLPYLQAVIYEGLRSEYSSEPSELHSPIFLRHQLDHGRLRITGIEVNKSTY